MSKYPLIDVTLSCCGSNENEDCKHTSVDVLFALLENGKNNEPVSMISLEDNLDFLALEGFNAILAALSRLAIGDEKLNIGSTGGLFSSKLLSGSLSE